MPAAVLPSPTAQIDLHSSRALPHNIDQRRITWKLQSPGSKNTGLRAPANIIKNIAGLGTSDNNASIFLHLLGNLKTA